MTNLDWLPLWLIVAALVVNTLIWFWAAHRELTGLRKCAVIAVGGWPALLAIKLISHFLA